MGQLSPGRATITAVHAGHAEPIVFEHEGKSYRARLLDDDAIGKWERWLRLEALKEAFLTAGDSPGAHRTVTEMGMAGAFGWLGSLSRTMIVTDRGRVALVAILCRIDQEEAARLWKEIPIEVGGVLAQVMKESLPDVPPPAPDFDPNGTGETGARTTALPSNSSASS